MTQEPSEGDFTLINEGKRAELALVVFEELIDKRAEAGVSKLIGIYNGGEVDPKPYLALVGELSVLGSLKNDLSRAVKKGRRTAEKVR